MSSSTTPSRRIGAFTAAAFVCGVGTIAQAEDVFLRFNGVGQHGNHVTVTLNNGMTFDDGSTQRSLWAGSNNFEGVTGASFETWCAEVTQNTGSGMFSGMSLSNGFGGGDTGDRRAAAIERLFAATDNGASIANSAEAVAFQAVIWEIAHEYDGLDGDINATSGDVQISDVDQRLFGVFRNLALHGNGEGVDPIGVWASDGMQNQISMVVIPLPSAAGMGLAGLGLISVRRVRRAS